MFKFKEIVIEKGRIRAADDNLQDSCSCKFSQELLDSLIDEVYEDYMEYDSSPIADWNYMGYRYRGKHPLSQIQKDDGTTGRGLGELFYSYQNKIVRSGPVGGNARVFHLVLLDSIGVCNFYLWYDAWKAGGAYYPIQKEKVKDLLLKNLEEVIIREES